MNLSEYRSDFTLFVAMSDLDLAGLIRSQLSQASYECFSFASYEVAEERFAEALPHILIFHLDDVRGEIADFLADIRRRAPELLLISVGSIEEREMMSRYFENGLYDHIVTGEGFSESIQWSVDRAAELLIYTYQNEQLLSQSQVAQPPTVASATEPQLSGIQQLASLERAQMALDKCWDEEDLVEALFVHLQQNLESKAQFLYFKFAPSAYSFVISHFSGALPADTKGVGFKLSEAEAKDFQSWMRYPSELVSLRKLLGQAFGCREFFAEIIRYEKKIFGLLVRMEPQEITDAQNIFHRLVTTHFKTRLELTFLREQSLLAEPRDLITGLYHESQFAKKLDEEIARSRRLKMPVCVIHAKLDRPEEFRRHFQEANYDQCLKNMADLVQKTSRVNDIVCRTGELQFSLILPHCARKGAAIRAERLRRIMESTPFTTSGLHITFTFGVAEYPSHALSVQELDKLAQLAVSQIQTRGGNKVCLATPPPGFTPDFEVPEL